MMVPWWTEDSGVRSTHPPPDGASCAGGPPLTLRTSEFRFMRNEAIIPGTVTPILGRKNQEPEAMEDAYRPLPTSGPQVQLPMTVLRTFGSVTTYSDGYFSKAGTAGPPDDPPQGAVVKVLVEDMAFIASPTGTKPLGPAAASMLAFGPNTYRPHE
jgi:hypothetical protein